MIDTHCHIQFQGYKDDRDEVILRCIKKGLIMNTIGTQKETSRLAVEIAEKYNNIYATIGLHPVHLFATQVDEEESKFLSHEEDFDEKYYLNLAKSKKVIGVGECGLDFFHLPNNIDFKIILEKQKKVFIQQFKFAQKNNLTLVVHTRDSEPDKNLPKAYDEMAKLLAKLIKKYGKIKGVIHCYSGNWIQAKKFLDLGFYLGFTGIITFPPRKTNPQPTLDLLEVVKNCPLDKIVVETDAPYLAPQLYRGKKCEPWMVEEVVKEIAKIRGKSVEEIIKITDDNAKKLFNI
ncbi:MAG TPA: TatD family hydrolase [Candidatus Magasanikbacteria bacterium]|jgi:TatD DNase family protein|nr:TatD family hydrolase [Candidatus Magasanikbacteria bacterium]NLZ97027.1 TatD family hydrolase [Candidatus Magasanikbacteria bacterium]HQF57287.1 TatD family hydrolase [Candidatus Magasanikbacteria bacterium]HQL52533.1 TatD family hydrolase [Candidatus Magasanikbacteria bacterium]